MSADNMLVIIPAKDDTAGVYDVGFSALSSIPTWGHGPTHEVCKWVASKGYLIGTYPRNKAYGEALRYSRDNIVEYGITDLTRE